MKASATFVRLAGVVSKSVFPSICVSPYLNLNPTLVLTPKRRGTVFVEEADFNIKMEIFTILN